MGLIVSRDLQRLDVTVTRMRHLRRLRGQERPNPGFASEVDGTSDLALPPGRQGGGGRIETSAVMANDAWFQRELYGAVQGGA